MKIIEGMKRLRVIEKRMTHNTDSINRYSSMVSTEKPLFETEEKQRKQIISLIQSNIDLLKEYLGFKKRIEKTNLETEIEINGELYTLSDILVIKRRLASKMIDTFKSLNDNEGSNRLRQHMSSYDGKAPHIVRYYKEEIKNEGLRFWQDMYDNIDSRLEVINATTDLCE